jgi:hypothetical protein
MQSLRQIRETWLCNAANVVARVDAKNTELVPMGQTAILSGTKYCAAHH